MIKIHTVFLAIFQIKSAKLQFTPKFFDTPFFYDLVSIYSNRPGFAEIHTFGFDNFIFSFMAVQFYKAFHFF